MVVLSQGTEDSREDIVFDRKYNGRRLIVVHHYDVENDPTVVLPKPNALDWHCGYMQVLPSDKNYDSVSSGPTWDGIDYDDLYPHASGGVALKGHIYCEPVNYYIGFDTLHYFNRDWTARDCIRALRGMADIDQALINSNSSKEIAMSNKVGFFKNDDNSYDVRIQKDGSDGYFAKYGELKFDKEQHVWVLWTGISYSDEDSGMSKESDEGVTYETNLEDTKDEIAGELEK